MSNYPPGVTGSEWQIAGPFAETEETLECPQCETETIVAVTTLSRSDDYDLCECTVCHYEWERQVESSLDAYDSWRDDHLA